jgi:hypothetical protein
MRIAAVRRAVADAAVSTMRGLSLPSPNR